MWQANRSRWKRAPCVLFLTFAGVAGCDGEPKEPSQPDEIEDTEALATARSAIVEPTCVTVMRGVFGTAEDALLSGDYPTWAAGDDSGLWTGISGGGSQNRILASFNLGFLSPYSKIVSATFRIKVAWNESHSTVRLHRVTQPWSEATVTFQNFGIAGYDPAVAGSFDPEGYTYESADVTEVVNEWVREIHPNYGFVLEEDPIAAHYYYSSESGPGSRPSLEVCYRNGPKPHRGGALVAGGVTSDSEGHHFIGALSEGPGRNQIASSENHRLIGGVVGATQQ